MTEFQLEEVRRCVEFLSNLLEAKLFETRAKERVVAMRDAVGAMFDEYEELSRFKEILNKQVPHVSATQPVSMTPTNANEYGYS